MRFPDRKHGGDNRYRCNAVIETFQVSVFDWFPRGSKCVPRRRRPVLVIWGRSMSQMARLAPPEKDLDIDRRPIHDSASVACASHHHHAHG